MYERGPVQAEKEWVNLTAEQRFAALKKDISAKIEASGFGWISEMRNPNKTIWLAIQSERISSQPIYGIRDLIDPFELKGYAIINAETLPAARKALRDYYRVLARYTDINQLGSIRTWVNRYQKLGTPDDKIREPMLAALESEVSPLLKRIKTETINKIGDRFRNYWKIHIAIAEADIPLFTNIMLDACKEDDVLRRQIAAFKVLMENAGEKKVLTPGSVARVVIYPTLHSEDQDDRKNTIDLIAKLQNILQPFESHVPPLEIGGIHRYSYPISRILHIAQGGELEKSSLLNDSGELELFDPCSNGAFLADESAEIINDLSSIQTEEAKRIAESFKEKT